MTESMMAYMIWLFVSLIFVVLGVYDMVNAHKGKVFGFYSNVKPPKTEELTNATAYNRALGKLLAGSGVALALIGLPLLGMDEDNGLLILLLLLGTFAWVIAMILIYTLKIEAKYRNKKK